MGDLTSSPAFWPGVMTLIGTVLVAWLGLKGKFTEATVGDQASFRRELLEQLNKEREAHDKLREEHFEMVAEFGELKVKYTALEARVLDLTNTIDSLRARSIEGEPLDRRALPRRQRLPGEEPSAPPDAEPAP